MVLIAGLACCIPLSARGARDWKPSDGCFSHPLPEPLAKVIRVEIKGKLEWQERPGFWRISSDAASYYLELGNKKAFSDLARRYRDQSVIVKGTLKRELLEGMEGAGPVNVVHATDLKCDDGGYVKMQVWGRLTTHETELSNARRSWPRTEWFVSADGQTFQLDFGGNEKLLELAKALRDAPVMINGTLKGNVLTVVTLSDARLIPL
jgi:hypothetical protein